MSRNSRNSSRRSRTAPQNKRELKNYQIIEIAEIARVAIERHNDDIGDQTDMSDEYLDELLDALNEFLAE